MEKKIKAIVLDLDGTALSPDKTFSTGIKEALRQAAEKGVHIIIATGRVYASLPKETDEIEGLEYVVTSNGASISHFPDEKVIYRNCVDARDVLWIKNLLEKDDVDTEIFFDGKAYIGQEYYDRILAGKTDRDIMYVRTTRTAAEDILQLMQENRERIENINLNLRKTEDKERWRELLSCRVSLSVTSSFPLNLEIGGAKNSKAEAVRRLVRFLGVETEEIMAFGDAENDKEMLLMAGLGVAMGNADEELKEISDYVTATNADDGVAKAVRKWVLQEKEDKGESQ